MAQIVQRVKKCIKYHKTKVQQNCETAFLNDRNKEQTHSNKTEAQNWEPSGTLNFSSRIGFKEKREVEIKREGEGHNKRRGS